MVAALLHAGWQPRRQVVVLLIAAPLLSLAAMLATDELVTAAVATLATVGVAIFLEQRRRAHASGEQPW